MKFCVHYMKNRNFKYLNEIDEIEYAYRSDDLNLITVLDSLEGSKRVILRITQIITEDDLRRFGVLEDEYPHLKFAYSLPDFKSESSREMFNQLAAAGHSAFFHTLVSDWTMLDTMKNMGVSDIYLVEDICFELDKAAAVLHEKGIKIRVFPNICQSSVDVADTSALKTFFIRPEDVIIYEPYVDIMEFMGKEDRIKTYYEIYAKNKRWLGTLDEMIIGLNEAVDSRGLSHIFAKQRIKCGKKCMKNSKCDICSKLAELSETLLENNLVFGKEQ